MSAGGCQTASPAGCPTGRKKNECLTRTKSPAMFPSAPDTRTRRSVNRLVKLLWQSRGREARGPSAGRLPVWSFGSIRHIRCHAKIVDRENRPIGQTAFLELFRRPLQPVHNG